MDAFATAAIACEVIYKTLESSAAFPSESKSLAARFKYDARILRHFCDYFSRHLDDAAGLSNEDRELLEESTSYLGALLNRVEVCKMKLTSQGRLSREINRLTWVLRRNEMKELEAELYEWTKRLDLRLVALPERARTVMSIGAEDEIKNFTPRLAARTRLERFTATAAVARKGIWERLMVDESRVQALELTDCERPFSISLFQEQHVLIEYRIVSMQTAHDEHAWKMDQASVGEFATALNYLDSTISGLLKCGGFFYSPVPTPAFGLVYRLPQARQTAAVVTSFKELLRARDSKGRRHKLRHTLNHRLEFAKKLATAVLFVHAIGWVHKAVVPQNVLILGKAASQREDKATKLPVWSLNSPYLVGFEIARSNDAETVPGARAQLPRDVALYLHPSLQETDHVRSTMAHDVYSLGVILLELGIMSPLEERQELMGDMTPTDIANVLFKLANETEILMGKRYREVVQTCLSQGEEGTTGGIRLISEVLEKLEDLTQNV